ncbi:MAG: hypothetical protein ACREOP_02880, partial [Thermodesulfobacteriota bacterium]
SDVHGGRPVLIGRGIKLLMFLGGGACNREQKEIYDKSMKILYKMLLAVIHLFSINARSIRVIAGISLLSRTVLSFEPVRRASTGGVSKFTSEYLLKAKPHWTI